jgi:DtxR family transcriptional regulator, Mn-dependent transcriptional regulator
LPESAGVHQPLTSAMEDYLEAIYHLEQEKRIARVRDIATRLGVKMSSVSSALKILGSRELIKYDPHQYITLTEKGIERAREIVRKHEVLKRFLVRVLQIEDSVAEDNACRIEHHLDPPVIEQLVRFVEFNEMCPVDQNRWSEGLGDSCDNCLPCLDKARQKMKTRARAQKAALAGGMTLAQACTGAQVVIEGLSGSSELQKRLSESGLESGAIAEIESVGPKGDRIGINVKGYHVTLSREDASTVLIKPM